MKLKPKHLEFVLNYLGTKDPAVAYGQTYPNASFKSYSAGASRILARPEVRDYVEFTERRMEDRLLTQIEAEQEAKKQQLLSINDKRAVLTKIITGETKRVRFIKNKYGPQKVEEDLPVYAVLRAVDMDTRLETFYNILLHRQDWSTPQSRTTYINTPTLQQQVNILISQATQEQNVNVNSPLEGGSLAEAGGCTLAQEQEISLPFRGIGGKPKPKQILSQSITCPPLQLLPQNHEITFPVACPPLAGVSVNTDGGGTSALEKAPSPRPSGLACLSLTKLAEESAGGGASLSEKNPLQLTKVNKTEKPIYNTDTKSTTKQTEGNQEKPCPTTEKSPVRPARMTRSDGGFRGSLAKKKNTPLVTPIPSIDYNPYTLEPLDPNIDYSYNPNLNPEKAIFNQEKSPARGFRGQLAHAPLPGKITVKPSMREYD